MLSTKAYQIVESGTRGKIVVAVRDIMPGELVVEEKEPVLYFTHAFYSQFDAGDTGLDKALPASSVYTKQLSPEKQRKFLTLFGPTTGPTAENVRNFARENMKYRFKNDEEPREMNADEIELFVKVAQVTRLNIFGSESFGYAVFEEITRLAHSCDANCNYAYTGTSMLCHANRRIEAGEELTISYVSSRDLEPTHERRFRYLERKEFTCHCRRCDAPGDDTRQFDCCDPSCKGVMMACEPISAKVLQTPHLWYTGVEYVEPHLLPCTVCHSSAPADYQAKMFHLEAHLFDLVQRYNHIPSALTKPYWEQVFQALQNREIPRRHASCVPLLDLEWHLKHTLFLNGLCSASSVKSLLFEVLANMENILKHPHSEWSKTLNAAVSVVCASDQRPILLPTEEKELCQKALRMHLLLRGRGKRDECLDGATARALQKLPSTAVSTEVCAFCEESPQRAALTLSRCGRCKQVMYCSAGCQKAHWPLHKKTCKA